MPIIALMGMKNKKLMNRSDMVKFIWDVIQEQDSQWMIPIIYERGIPMTYLKRPKDAEIEEKLAAIFKYLYGSRNFILLVSNKAAYVNSLFYYIGLTWLATSNKLFNIVDLAKLKEDPTLFNVIENTGLLLVPHTHIHSEYSLREMRDRVGSLLIKRQTRRMPTIIEVYSTKAPAKMDMSDIIGSIKSLASVFGTGCAGTFTVKDSNVKILRLL
jgi:hypothetical protein